MCVVLVVFVMLFSGGMQGGPARGGGWSNVYAHFQDFSLYWRIWVKIVILFLPTPWERLFSNDKCYLPLQSCHLAQWLWLWFVTTPVFCFLVLLSIHRKLCTSLCATTLSVSYGLDISILFFWDTEILDKRTNNLEISSCLEVVLRSTDMSCGVACYGPGDDPKRSRYLLEYPKLEDFVQCVAAASQDTMPYLYFVFTIQPY